VEWRSAEAAPRGKSPPRSGGRGDLRDFDSLCRLVDRKQRRIRAVRRSPESFLRVGFALDLELPLRGRGVDRSDEFALELRIGVHRAAGFEPGAAAEPELVAKQRVLLRLGRDRCDVDFDDFDELVELAGLALRAEFVGDAAAVATRRIDLDSNPLARLPDAAHHLQHHAGDLLRVVAVDRCREPVFALEVGRRVEHEAAPRARRREVIAEARHVDADVERPAEVVFGRERLPRLARFLDHAEADHGVRDVLREVAGDADLVERRFLAVRFRDLAFVRAFGDAGNELEPGAVVRRVLDRKVDLVPERAPDLERLEEPARRLRRVREREHLRAAGHVAGESLVDLGGDAGPFVQHEQQSRAGEARGVLRDLCREADDLAAVRPLAAGSGIERWLWEERDAVSLQPAVNVPEFAPKDAPHLAVRRCGENRSTLFVGTDPPDRDDDGDERLAELVAAANRDLRVLEHRARDVGLIRAPARPLPRVAERTLRELELELVAELVAREANRVVSVFDENGISGELRAGCRLLRLLLFRPSLGRELRLKALQPPDPAD
jgi:hypothetical protein